MELFGADHTRVKAQQVQTTVETGVLHLDAAVHHHGESLFLTITSSFFVIDTELNPDGLCPNCHHIIDDGRNVTALAENIHNVWNFRQRSKVWIDLSLPRFRQRWG